MTANDCVNRVAVIGCLLEIMKENPDNGNLLVWMMTAINEIKSIPAADAESTLRWIPCDKKLPKDGQLVVLLYKHYNYADPTQEVEDYAFGFRLRGTWFYHSDFADDEVVCWCPLPKEDDNETD